MKNMLLAHALNVLYDTKKIPNGRKLEFITSNLAKMTGFKSYTTPATRDRGLDVIATTPDGEKIGFQCKHHKKSGIVPFKDVGETLLGSKIYNVDVTVIITDGRFSKYAEHYAHQFGIHCWAEGQYLNWVVTVAKINGTKEYKINTNHQNKKLRHREYFHSFSQLSYAVNHIHDYSLMELTNYIYKHKHGNSKISDYDRWNIMKSHEFISNAYNNFITSDLDEICNKFKITHQDLDDLLTFLPYHYHM